MFARPGQEPTQVGRTLQVFPFSKLLPYPYTLDKVGKAYQGQTL